MTVLHVICKNIYMTYYKTCKVVKHQNDNKYNDAFFEISKVFRIKKDQFKRRVTEMLIVFKRDEMHNI